MVGQKVRKSARGGHSRIQSKEKPRKGSIVVIGNLFRKNRGEEARERPTLLTGPRVPRHSSGWQALLKHLREEDNLRVLDIGPTSPQNINFLTGMGHSVYMADVVHESLRGGWEMAPAEPGEQPGFDVRGFFEQNLNFHGRQFDVVLLWATMDYIPGALTAPLVERLRTKSPFSSGMAGKTPESPTASSPMRPPPSRPPAFLLISTSARLTMAPMRPTTAQ